MADMQRPHLPRQHLHPPPHSDTSIRTPQYIINNAVLVRFHNISIMTRLTGLRFYVPSNTK